MITETRICLPFSFLHIISSIKSKNITFWLSLSREWYVSQRISFSLSFTYLILFCYIEMYISYCLTTNNILSKQWKNTKGVFVTVKLVCYICVEWCTKQKPSDYLNYNSWCVTHQWHTILSCLHLVSDLSSKTML